MIIILLAAQLGASIKKESSFVLDFSKVEELEKLQRELTLQQQVNEKLNRMLAEEGVGTSNVRNVTVNRSELKDDRGTDAEQLYKDAERLQKSLDKTFNRGYCDILSLMASPSGGWACMDAPKNMGEFIGKVIGVRPASVSGCVEVILDSSTELANGDGFAFVCGSSIVGFRGDVCSAGHIVCKKVDGLRPGVEIFRNVSQSFERALKAAAPSRLLAVDVGLAVEDGSLVATARCEDGSEACASLPFSEYARDSQRAAESIAAVLAGGDTNVINASSVKIASMSEIGRKAEIKQFTVEFKSK